MKGLMGRVKITLLAVIFSLFLFSMALAKMNINTASVEELTELPGVGKVVAERIVSYREANGPFKSPEDLIKVKGIGQRKLEKILPLITVEPEVKENQN